VTFTAEETGELPELAAVNASNESTPEAEAAIPVDMLPLVQS
jgi:hypothetical protein